MRILFIGTVIFSKNILDEIVKSKNKIVGVIGGEKKKFNSDLCDLVKYSKLKKIDSIYAKNINSNKILKWVKKKEARHYFLRRMESIVEKTNFKYCT